MIGESSRWIHNFGTRFTNVSKVHKVLIWPMNISNAFYLPICYVRIGGYDELLSFIIILLQLQHSDYILLIFVESGVTFLMMHILFNVRNNLTMYFLFFNMIPLEVMMGYYLHHIMFKY